MIPSTYHLHVQGQVQGVGFRPFVYRLASAHHLPGWVTNAVDGVHIEVNADEDRIQRFEDELINQAPALSRITRLQKWAVPSVVYTGFEIRESPLGGQPNLLLTPDLALCADCRQELGNLEDRRFGYGFVTCTYCGPRYSIVSGLPFDRERTTMSAFTQCPACAAEYLDLNNRRYFSQTNSCPDCGVVLHFSAKNNPVQEALGALNAGKIAAVKGIGGWLLLCDATNGVAIDRLRTRKHRPTKPFAVLYPDVTLLESDVLLHPEAKALLQSPESPIVLVPLKAHPASGILPSQLAPNLDQLGVMLPYAPLLLLLATGFGKPLVATSGNISGSPIAFTDAQAAEYLGEIADCFLGHNREIVTPLDDSLVRLTPLYNQQILLRRSRGYAPTLLPVRLPPQGNLLAMGADLKAAFAWQNQDNCFVSQFLGDLASYDSQEQFRSVVGHFQHLLQATPEKVVVDAHPGYFSHSLGRALAEKWGVPVAEQYHHEAHFAAVLAENDLLTSTEPVLGIIWDGTGYGRDGNLWGGEFFSYEQGEIQSLCHLEPFPVLGGDKMALDPRLSALSIGGDQSAILDIIRPRFSESAWNLYTRLLGGSSAGRLTRSMGRVFDAVAALLGVGDENSFEGESAMRLETLATAWVKLHGHDSLETGAHFSPSLTPQIWLTDVADCLKQGQEPGEVAARFIFGLAGLVAWVAEQNGYRHLAFSGGVFQNGLLRDLLEIRLGRAFCLYFHLQLSPNDECIGYGQLALHSLQNQPFIQPAHVFGNSR